MTITEDTGQRLAGRATMQWIPLADMDVSPLAQRARRDSHVNQLAAKFNIDLIGHPVVNRRDGRVFIIDGQHRKWAADRVGLGSGSVECETFEDLTEQQEADMFLELNSDLPVSAFEKFKIAVTAGRFEQCQINDIVGAAGLKIALSKEDGSVGCVSTLTDIFRKGGEECLARTLVIVLESYGYSGLEAQVIGGVGLLLQRYGAILTNSRAIASLAPAPGGAFGLLQKARAVKRQYGKSLRFCVAAAATETINAGRGGRKLPDWWRAGAGPRSRRETPQAALADAV